LSVSGLMPWTTSPIVVASYVELVNSGTRGIDTRF
jgi:hypothetical protein